jgi:hypothetical protein
MAAMAVVDEVEDAEALEAADASLSDRLDFSFIFVGNSYRAVIANVQKWGILT